MFIDPAKPALVLAPMEGVLDAPMRALIAEAGGFDFAVSEFVRVSQGVISAKVIARQVPELSGTRLGRATLPIQVQLLGSSPELLAATALEACAAGARAIDLNFGCPSPTVIRRQGGSALLREPARIRRIVEAVRGALPSAIPVSAKLRLGWDDPRELPEIARAAADGGASWLTVHARTRAQLYRPGVTWEPVREVARSSSIPVVANGDLFSVADLDRCRDVTGCRHFMIGRGALLNPFVGREMAQALGLKRPEPALAEPGLLSAVRRFIQIAHPMAPNNGYVPCRIKQWIGSIRALDAPLITRTLMSAAGRARSTAELLSLLENADLTQG